MLITTQHSLGILVVLTVLASSTGAWAETTPTQLPHTTGIRRPAQLLASPATGSRVVATTSSIKNIPDGDQALLRELLAQAGKEPSTNQAMYRP